MIRWFQGRNMQEGTVASTQRNKLEERAGLDAVPKVVSLSPAQTPREVCLFSRLAAPRPMKVMWLSLSTISSYHLISQITSSTLFYALETHCELSSVKGWLCKYGISVQSCYKQQRPEISNSMVWGNPGFPSIFLFILCYVEVNGIY